ncbi:unnamed protein product, partial [Heterosigma akashiwo]
MGQQADDPPHHESYAQRLGCYAFRFGLRRVAVPLQVFGLLCTLSGLVQLFRHPSFLDGQKPFARKLLQDPSTPTLYYDGVDIFNTKAVALPSITLTEEEQQLVFAEKNLKNGRGRYGGAGDGLHLGGFTDLDMDGISPAVWKLMVEWFGVKSLVDLGCGKGVSAAWFALHGVRTVCAEGSADAARQTLLPRPAEQLVQHDFSRGPWWPEETVDAVWTVEFIEHVQRQHLRNYLPVLKKAALVFVSHSTWGGWHHAEVHDARWWIAKYTAAGLVYSKTLTDLVRRTAAKEYQDRRPAPNGKFVYAQHVSVHMLVFANPPGGLRSTTTLRGSPLLRGKGEEKGSAAAAGAQRHGDEDLMGPLPEEYQPLRPLRGDSWQEQDEAWERLVFGKTFA